MTDEPGASASPPADPLDTLAKEFGPRIDEAREKLKVVNENVKAFVRENPLPTLLGAVAVGFVVGRLASRK